jgi:transmembrane sensor
MDQNKFAEILRRYIQGNASRDEKKFIDAWYNNVENGADDQDIPNDNELWLHFEPLIRRHINREPHKIRRHSFINWYSTGVAATIFVVIGLYFVFNKVSLDPQQSQKEMVAIQWEEVINNSDVPKRIVLSDKSSVTLGPKALLKFPKQFIGNERTVYVRGDAFFEISHDTTRPFFVHVGEVTTRVLGTSFNINSDEKKVVVSVKTGKVSVTANSTKTEAVVLTPNQQAVYDKANELLSKGIVESPTTILSAEELTKLRFEEQSASKIFEAIEKIYGIHLVFDKETFSNCLLTTTISDDDLFKKLDVVCQAIGATYERNVDRIIINGAGCKKQDY